MDSLLAQKNSPMIRDRRVSDECSFSDQQLISFNINLFGGFHKAFRNLSRTDWIRYEKTVEVELRALRGHSTFGINDRVRSLTDILFSYYRDAYPLTYPAKRSQPAWWNAELQRLCCCTKKLFYKAKRSGKEIKRSKRTTWMLPKWLLSVGCCLGTPKS